MSSKKWMPWDFLKNNGALFESGLQKLTLQFDDPVIEKLILDILLEKTKEEFTKVFPDEVTNEWIENNILGLDLFGGNEFFLFYFVNKIPSNIFKDLLEALDQTNKKAYFFYSGTDKNLTKNLKTHKVESFYISSPPFWDNDKLLSFVGKVLNINLSYDLQSYILEVIENDSMSFYTALNTLKLNFKNKDINLSMAKDVLESNKVDQFKAAELLGSKKLKGLYLYLAQFAGEFGAIENLLRFLESHLFKLYDNSYIEKKSRPTKYDRQIMTHSKLWTKDEIVELLNIFSNYLILAKKKDHNLLLHLKHDLI